MNKKKSFDFKILIPVIINVMELNKTLIQLIEKINQI